MSFYQRAAVLMLLVLFFVCANLITPWLLWDVAGWNLRLYCGLFAFGGLIAEVCLLAVWNALGAQSFIFRMPLTAALAVVASCFYVLGLQVLWDEMPLDLGVFMIVAGLMMYVCVQVPLWGLRLITQSRIDVPVEENASRSAGAAGQFRMRHLLIGTAAIGLLLVLVRYSLPTGHFDGPVRGYVREVVDGFTFAAFSAAICLPCVLLTLGDRGRGLWALVLLIVMLCGPLAVFGVLVGIDSAGPGLVEVFVAIYVFGLGTAATLILVLLIVRAIGFRLMREGSGRDDRNSTDRNRSSS